MKKFSYILLFSILSIYIYFPACTSYKGLPQCELLDADTNQVLLNHYDSVTLFATKFYEGGLIKKAMQGTGYRKAWKTPIRVALVDFSKIHGGIKPIEEGGGNQTQSLAFEDSLGNVYSLRSINKDPAGLVPNIVWKLGLENIIIDGISAQHPYGALIIPVMADAVGLWHTNPRLFFVPEQPSLGQFNEKYKNRIYLLEYETKGSGKWTQLEKVNKITDTEGLIKMMLKDSGVSFDTAALVRARLFDFLIGDWDRHAKQWGWIITKEETRKKGIPISCDRDNAFYGIGGLIPSIINRPFIQPILRPFKKDIDYLPGMVKAFDQYFLINAEEVIFQEQAAYLQEHLTDEIIEKSLRSWPEELYEIDGKKISDKIKSRREKLPEYATKFYKVIQQRGPLKKPLKGSTKLWSEMEIANN